MCPEPPNLMYRNIPNLLLWMHRVFLGYYAVTREMKYCLREASLSHLEWN